MPLSTQVYFDNIIHQLEPLDKSKTIVDYINQIDDKDFSLLNEAPSASAFNVSKMGFVKGPLSEASADVMRHARNSLNKPVEPFRCLLHRPQSPALVNTNPNLFILSFYGRFLTAKAAHKLTKACDNKVYPNSPEYFTPCIYAEAPIISADTTTADLLARICSNLSPVHLTTFGTLCAMPVSDRTHLPEGGLSREEQSYDHSTLCCGHVADAVFFSPTSRRSSTIHVFRIKDNVVTRIYEHKMQAKKEETTPAVSLEALVDQVQTKVVVNTAPLIPDTEIVTGRNPASIVDSSIPRSSVGSMPF